MRSDRHYINIALEEAAKAGEQSEVPIGAVVVDSDSGDIIARAGNRTRALNDPTAHAEILAIRDACEKAGAQRIPEFDLYVTLEPCAMCAAAISFARIGRVVFGASDSKGGGILHGGKFFEQPTCHHRPIVKDSVMPEECGKLLKDFFSDKR